MPACSCTTITSTAKSDILLVSRLHGIEMGELALRPGRPERFRFDWAGTATDDFYQVTGYELNGAVRGAQLAALNTQITLDPEVASMSCGAQNCPFGALNMGHAWSESLGQTGAEMYPVGVNTIHAGKSIAANTRSGTCGCMMLRNKSKMPVELRSRLHGRDRGMMLFPPGETRGIGFDYAGDNPDDAYLIDAMLESADPTSPQQIALTLSDYIEIFGQFYAVGCPQAGADDLDAVHVPINGVDVLCPFGPLRMSERLTGVTGSPTPAPVSSAKPGTTVVAKRDQ